MFVPVFVFMVPVEGQLGGHGWEENGGPPSTQELLSEQLMFLLVKLGGVQEEM